MLAAAGAAGALLDADADALAAIDAVAEAAYELVGELAAVVFEPLLPHAAGAAAIAATDTAASSW